MIHLLTTVFRIIVIAGLLAPIWFVQIKTPFAWFLVIFWTISAINAGFQQLPGTYTLSGLSRLHPKYSDAIGLIKRRISRARHSVKIADTYLGDFDALQASVEAALKRKNLTTVKILLAKPGGHFSSSRRVFSESTIAQNVQALHTRIREFQRQLSDVPGAPDRIQVRFFDAVIPGPIFIVDDRHVFVGSYLQDRGSQHSPMMQFRIWPWTKLPKNYVLTLDKLWDSASDEP